MASLSATTSSESPLDRTWTALRHSRRCGLVSYLTAGFPTVADSRAALQMAAETSDVIEVGVPFSDPLADGPTIQRSTFRALENGMTLAGTLDLIAAAELRRPLVLFSYLNPVLQYGVDRLLRDAAELGVAGLLLTDLPAGGDAAIERAVQQSPLDLIRLVAPTSRPERIRGAVTGAQGFVYLVARLGVTGASTGLAADLGESVARVRAATALPVAVGFGISTPAQATAVARIADGVVVGSALVDELGGGGVSAAGRFLEGLRAALDIA
jgi:tryptophan synthase alpha chain